MARKEPKLAAPLWLLLSTATLLPACGDGDADPAALVEHEYTLSGPAGDVLDVTLLVPREVRVGNEVEYRIVVRNASDEPVTGVIVREQVPRGFEVLDASVMRGSGEVDPARGRPVEAAAPRGTLGDVARDAGELVLLLGSFQPDEWATITIAGLVRAEGSAAARTVVSYDALLTAEWRVVRPELHLDLRLGDDAAWICDAVPVAVHLENRGTGTTGKGQLRLRLPEGLRTAEGAAEVALDFESFDAGDAFDETVHLRAERPGEFQLQALAATDRLEVRSGTRVLRVVEPRLALSVEPVGTVPLQGSHRVGVLLTNTGEVAVTEVVLRVEGERAMEAGLVTGEPRGDGDTEDVDDALDIGSLEPGEQRRLALVLFPRVAGESFELLLAATARCLQDERALRERVAGTVSGIAALGVTLVDELDPVAVGGTTTYRVLIQNQGSAVDRGVEAALRLPPELAFLRGTGATLVEADGELVRFATVDALPPGETVEWRVEVRALAAASTSAALQVRSGASPDPVRAEEPTTVVE